MSLLFSIWSFIKQVFFFLKKKKEKKQRKFNGRIVERAQFNKVTKSSREEQTILINAIIFLLLLN